MTIQDKPRRRRRGPIILAIACAVLTCTVGGAVGGAAGAYWVVERMAKPRFAPKIKNAVVSYEMPAEGARRDTRGLGTHAAEHRSTPASCPS